MVIVIAGNCPFPDTFYLIPRKKSYFYDFENTFIFLYVVVPFLCSLGAIFSSLFAEFTNGSTIRVFGGIVWCRKYAAHVLTRKLDCKLITARAYATIGPTIRRCIHCLNRWEYQLVLHFTFPSFLSLSIYCILSQDVAALKALLDRARTTRISLPLAYGPLLDIDLILKVGSLPW